MQILKKYLLLIIFLPIFVFSQEITTPINLLAKEAQQSSQENSNQTEETNTKEDSQNFEEQINAQNKLVQDIIENINNESLLTTLPNKDFYTNEINILTNKININNLQGNVLAVKRDEIKVDYLKEKLIYETTLKNIIIAKQEFRNREYFEEILEKNIKVIKASNLDNYKKFYENESKNLNSNKISSDLVNNYINLYNQKHSQLFVLQYLYTNIQKFRTSNFFMDEFNLNYIINKIDKIKEISSISSFTSYHFDFSVGELTVAILIILFFRLINRYLISILTNFISKLFLKFKNQNLEENIILHLKDSINTPLIYSLYLLSIQLSMLILIKDQNFINNITPWINTIYMALLTWAIYSILNTGISIYAQNLLEKYQNVRKEMIVFILKIIKVVLVLVVVLFLFTQLGIDVKAIAASLGVGGIAIALAAKDTLANFFASLNIMTDNSFSQGDWIRTNDFEGTVVDIRMRTTRIRTFDNAMITVPNSQIANAHIMNWSKRIIGRRIKMSIGITYESDMKDIINLKDEIYDMLSNHPRIATNKNTNISRRKAFEAIKREDLEGIKNTLLVFIDEYSSSSIDILVYCFSKSPVWEEWLDTKEDVMIKISELVEKNNCSFAYPAQTIFLKTDEEIKEKIEEI